MKMLHDDIIQSSSRAVISNLSTVYDTFAELNAEILQGQTGFDIVLRDIIHFHLFSKIKFI